MKIKDARRLSIVLSCSLICLGLSQWLNPNESSMRWKWLQEITNNLFGTNGYALFLMSIGSLWLIFNLISMIKGEEKE